MSHEPPMDPRSETAQEPAREITHHEPPPGARGMNVLRWVLFAGLLLLAGISIASYVAWRFQNRAGANATRTARYYCPMHPSYTSDKKGECPICGMDLEPIPASTAAHDSSAHAGDVPGLAPVHLTPERIQMIGVRYAVVERRALGSDLELVGFIAPDETRLRRIQLRVAGWVQDLYVNQTGQQVEAGQPLLAIYSPELYQTENEFLIETGGPASSGGDAGAHERAHSSTPSVPTASSAARQRLQLLGVPPAEIARLERERTPSTRLVLPAPVSGTVLERNVVEGQSVGADLPLFTVADLSRVWAVADVYEMDFGKVRVRDRASFTADALPTRGFAGVVEFVDPTVTSQTRTLKVRVPLANTTGALKPGMYGRVKIVGRGTPALAIPSEAVIRAGEHDYVFVAHTGGHFEPRIVRPGSPAGDWVSILSGVAEGDTVVASASFLVDSESRLKAAIAGMGAPPAPHTGHAGTP
jgi:Cu(I)/Ag(I) efflux system membrane fusion protein